MSEAPKAWKRAVDVIVVGSGCAGLTAALAARANGADVLVLEKTDKIGGTTAVSAGALWIPGNHHMAASGEPDVRADAIGYITQQAEGLGDEDLIARFVDAGPEMVRFVEDHSTARFAILSNFPDYHPERPGGRLRGRSLDVNVFDTRGLGDWAAALRRSPVFALLPLSINELREYGLGANPFNTPMALVQERVAQGMVSFGTALVGHLLKAALDQGIEVLSNAPVKELVLAAGRITGVIIEHAGATVRIEAKRGVILASGGFEWNKQLTAQFLGGQPTHPQSPPANEGDGLRMAMALGADLGNMHEAWWCPVHALPGEQYDAQPLYRGDFTTMRGLPHTLIINRAGRRFVNEALTYNQFTKALLQSDPNTATRPNLPAWLVLDQQYLAKYTLHTYFPGMPLPEWLITANTWAELAAKLGVDAQALEATVTQFNTYAQTGVDVDFKRGESAHDRDYGDARSTPNPNLGTLTQPPFCALPIHVGALGTKGGVRINEHAQVKHASGAVIAGLYAAGNVTAGITGAGYPGGGATIGVAMTFGYLAGRHAAQA